jgi:hypothetical protein
LELEPRRSRRCRGTTSVRRQRASGSRRQTLACCVCRLTTSSRAARGRGPREAVLRAYVVAFGRGSILMICRRHRLRLECSADQRVMDAPSAERLIRELLPAVRARGGDKAQRLEASLSQMTADIAAARDSKSAGVKATIVGTLAQLDAAVESRQRKHAAASPELNCWMVLGQDGPAAGRRCRLAGRQTAAWRLAMPVACRPWSVVRFLSS